MDSGTNMPRLYLFLLRILQCLAALTIIIIEILRHTGTIYLIESKMDMENDYELFFEYCVMNLGFVTSALYIFRFNQRWKQGPYKYDILVDCVLMNAWMIFGILRLSPEFDNNNFLNCSQYESELAEQRKGCITYISTLVLGFSISASYFFTAIVSTLLWTRKKSLETKTNTNTNFNTNFNSTLNLTNNNIDNTNNNSNSLSSKSSIKNSQIANDVLQTITVTQGEIINSELCAEISLSEFITHNKHLINENSEFNGTDGSIIKFSKPSPCFLKHEFLKHEPSSLYECNTYSIKSSISQYSLDSSFSRTYGSIIIPRKYTAPSETDTIASSMLSRYDGSIIIGRNQSISSYTSFSDNSTRLSSSFSEVTSRSSKYDGSIIIKLVT